MSQHVADGLRHENRQKSASFAPMSQKSQMSQGPYSAVVRNGMPTGREVDHKTDRAEPKVLTPVTWYEHLASPTHHEAPWDEACPERRGRVEQVGSVFLHFCMTCGAWGSFGYGVTGDRLGLWYCGKHRPNGDQHPVRGEVAADGLR
jgi:hypothetical protein